MTDRRNFLKAVTTIAAGLAATRLSTARAGEFPAGLIYTGNSPGRWAELANIHAPLVSREGNRITIVTKHPMSEPHYIVKHTLVAADGEVLGDRTFFPTDKEAISVHEVPAGKVPEYATSFCNRHDFWVTLI